MTVIKEPKGIDFVVNSEPWSEKELKDFRKLMKKKKSELGEEKRSKIKETFNRISKSKQSA